MDMDQIRTMKQQIVERFGPWTAHCIHLGAGLYTFDEPHIDTRARRFVQIAADVIGEPLDKVRVLDLACLEGMFGIEFARHGAKVLAIEGRKTSLEKARFVKEMLALHNLELLLDDIRNFTAERHGYFDVILCLGILYHLDTPDAMEFLESISNACARVTIIDTNFSLSDEESCSWKGRTYWGRYWREHSPDDVRGQKMQRTWASLDNPRSFLFTRASLCNLLRHVGFTSVYEGLNPYEYHNPHWPGPPQGEGHVVLKDRITLVAIKGQPQTVLTSPLTQGSPEIDRPERPEYQTVGPPPRTPPSALGRLLPVRLKKALRRFLGRA
jgi:SAM-dependent methyltransferase